MKMMQRQGLVAQNVAIPVKIALRQRDKRKLDPGVDMPTFAQMERLIEKCGELADTPTAKRKAGQKPYQMFRVFLIVAAFAGLRSSEMRALQWRDIDLGSGSGGRLKVRRAADPDCRIDTTKSYAGQRTVPIDQRLVEVLKEWRLACPIGALQLVFPNQAGEVHRLSNIEWRVWYPLQRACGFVDHHGETMFVLHSLRHFCVTTWVEAGYRVNKIAAMIGHASPKTTLDVYTHLFPDETDDAARLAGIADRFPSLRGVTTRVGNTVVPLKLAERIAAVPVPSPSTAGLRPALRFVSEPRPAVTPQPTANPGAKIILRRPTR
jgi:integrase